MATSPGLTPPPPQVAALSHRTNPPPSSLATTVVRFAAVGLLYVKTLLSITAHDHNLEEDVDMNGLISAFVSAFEPLPLSRHGLPLPSSRPHGCALGRLDARGFASPSRLHPCQSCCP